MREVLIKDEEGEFTRNGLFHNWLSAQSREGEAETPPVQYAIIELEDGTTESLPNTEFKFVK